MPLIDVCRQRCSIISSGFVCTSCMGYYWKHSCSNSCVHSLGAVLYAGNIVQLEYSIARNLKSVFVVIILHYQHIMNTEMHKCVTRRWQNMLTTRQPTLYVQFMQILIVLRIQRKEGSWKHCRRTIQRWCYAMQPWLFVGWSGNVVQQFAKFREETGTVYAFVHSLRAWGWNAFERWSHWRIYVIEL